jgi:nitroreductase
MEFYETIGMRRSVRSFTKDAVPEEVLDRIFEAAREAPSANNLMPWRFVVVSDPGKRAVLASGIYGKFLKEAPVVIAACGDVKASPEWYKVDTAIAIEHVVLAATAEGLGSCWVGSFEKAGAMDVLGVPPGYDVLALLAIGYSRDRPDVKRFASHLIRPNKKLSSLVYKEDFGNPWSRV